MTGGRAVLVEDAPWLLASNITATTDPGPTNDTTQGFVVNSTWFNSTLNRTWVAASVAKNAAVWIYDGTPPSTGSAPPNMQSQFGGGTGTFGMSGVLARSIVSAGVTPASTAADIVLATAVIPAGSFDVANRGLNILASGSFAATANNKTLKITFGATAATVGTAVGGGTVVASTGVLATSGGGWNIGAKVVKYGTAASNTQIATQLPGSGTFVAPALCTQTESSACTIAVTGNAAAAASDIVYNALEIVALD